MLAIIVVIETVLAILYMPMPLFFPLMETVIAIGGVVVFRFAYEIAKFNAQRRYNWFIKDAMNKEVEPSNRLVWGTRIAALMLVFLPAIVMIALYIHIYTYFYRFPRRASRSNRAVRLCWRAVFQICI